MAMFFKVLLLLTVLTVASARKIPFTESVQAAQLWQTSPSNGHEHTTTREELRHDDVQGDPQQSNLKTNQQEHETHSATHRKSFRNIDTRAYDNLNIKINTENDPNIQGNQVVKSNSNNGIRSNNRNKGVNPTVHTHASHENRRNIKNKKQHSTDGRVNEREKTTRDNEVTPRTENRYKKPKDQEDDRWIWMDGEQVATTQATSKGVTFEDRASFAADNCPTGQVKFNNKCVEED